MAISAPRALPQSRFAVLVVAATIAPRASPTGLQMFLLHRRPRGTGFLSLLQVSSFDQRLPRCQAHQRNAGRFFHSECSGLDCHGIFIYRDEFHERTDSIFIGSPIAAFLPIRATLERRPGSTFLGNGNVRNRTQPAPRCTSTPTSGPWDGIPPSGGDRSARPRAAGAAQGQRAKP